MVDIGWGFPMSAMNIKKGILKNSPNKKWTNDLKESDKISQLTHATTIIGWGVDPKDHTKYWIVRNSYGPNWGDKGDLKVLRGVNAFNIESFAGGYDVELISY